MVDIRLNRGHKVVTWIDISGWNGVTYIIWNLAGDKGQNAGPPKGVRLGCKVPGAPS